MNKSQYVISICESRNPDPTPDVIKDIASKHRITPKDGKVPYLVMKNDGKNWNEETGTLDVRVGDRVVAQAGNGHEYFGIFLAYQGSDIVIIKRGTSEVVRVPRSTLSGHKDFPRGPEYGGTNDVNSKYW